jgi:hypothetical protein
LRTTAGDAHTLFWLFRLRPYRPGTPGSKQYGYFGNLHFFDAARLPVKARVFAFLFMRCCCAMFAFRCFSAIFRYIFVFVTFEALANPQRGIIGLIFENFSVL